MIEIPTPTLYCSELDWFRSKPSFPVEKPPKKSFKSPSMVAQWAKSPEEVLQAQRLRYQIFVDEMGANISTTKAGYDIDIFDSFCEHLLVRDAATDQVVGTYRLLTPTQAARVGSTYTETEFDLVRLRSLKGSMVEVGRSCVHPDYRHGGVMMNLWAALAEFMERNQFSTMIGCASMPMQDGGYAAAAVWQELKRHHLAKPEYQVMPRLPLPIEDLQACEQQDLAVANGRAVKQTMPALIKGYMRVGAKVMGPPAWDPEFNCVDFPIFLRLEDIAKRYAKHFLKAKS